MRAVIALFVVGTLASCVDTGRTRLAFPVHGAGTDRRTFDVDDWSVTLDEARVAFGPAYFCTTAAADVDLCEDAIAELRASGTFDALDPAPQVIGELQGLSGTTRSLMFDYGISWLLPAQDPAPTPGAVDGAHSLHLAGSVTRGATTIRFVADVDVRPISAGLSATHGVASEHVLVDGSDALTVHVDPSAWVSRIDFDELETLTGDPVVLTEETTAYQALLIAMTSSRLPMLEWARASP
jgi:hypothetical protein